MITWRIMARTLLPASAILASFLSMTCCSFAARETAREALQETSDNYSEMKPSIDTGSALVETFRNDQSSAKIHDEQGVAYSKKGQYDLAIAEFDKALRIVPLAAEIYNNRGITYSKKGEYNLAISDFTRALEINRNDAPVYYNRGITFAIIMRFDLALADFDKCLELDPGNVAIYNIKGSVYAILACSNWGEACKAGNCKQIKEAMRIGLCTETNKQSMLAQ